MSFLWTCFAFWFTHLSRDAKRDATNAKDHAVQAALSAAQLVKAAEDQAAAAKQQAGSVKSIADHFKTPPLVIEHTTGVLWRIRNTTQQPLTIESIVNADEAPTIELKVPTTIPGLRSQEFMGFKSGQGLFPAELVLKVSGLTEPLTVSFPSTPSK